SYNEMISQLESRINQPERFKLSADISKYKKGLQKAKYNRAMLILKHRNDLLQPNKATAIKDFKMLEKVKFPPGNFQDEIALLKDPTPDPLPNTPETERLNITGVVVTEHGAPIRGAVVSLDGKSDLTNASGIYELGEFDITDVFAKELLVSADGFERLKVTITSNTITKIILHTLDKPRQIVMQGNVFSETGAGIVEAMLVFNNSKTFTGSNGEYSFGPINEDDIIGKEMQITKDGYKDLKLTLSSNTFQRITLKPVQPPQFTVGIRAFGPDDTYYSKILSSLKSSGYNIVSESNSPTPPEGEQVENKVIYHIPGNEEQAFRIAAQMRQWTDRDYKVEFQALKSTTRIHSDVFRNNIMITWIHSVRIN
ncbi:MAG: carboxypeptidase-like regulatory domain-containing protein, partial [Bacteroidota bacterium]|nr:carboxypeptidase-like regulatory domain-containing protein [Bacteroidota bacterium]